MATVKALMAYRLTVRGQGIASGKPSQNVIWLRAREGFPTQLYGVSIPGSDTGLVITSFRALWIAQVCALMSTDYKVVKYDLDQLTGYTTPALPAIIVNASNTNPVTITVFGAHGLSNGDVIVISGCLGNTSPNGTWPVTVTGPNTFTIPVAGNGFYTGGGSYVPLFSSPTLLFGDHDEYTPVGGDLGGVAGDPMPLFCCVSARKPNGSSSRNYRGNVHLSPIPETQQQEGRLTAGAYASWTTALHTFWVGPVYFAAVGDAHNWLDPIQLSKKRALTTVQPWSSTSNFTRNILDIVPHQNLGSEVRRKPKLTAVIA